MLAQNGHSLQVIAGDCGDLIYLAVLLGHDQHH